MPGISNSKFSIALIAGFRGNYLWYKIDLQEYIWCIKPKDQIFQKEYTHLETFRVSKAALVGLQLFIPVILHPLLTALSSDGAFYNGLPPTSRTIEPI